MSVSTDTCLGDQVANVDLQPGGPILAAALGCRRRGWAVFPIAAGTKVPPRGFKLKQYRMKLPTEEELRFWFADRDDLGLAVLLGDASGGLVCRDFDDRDAYNRWKRAHPDLARMLPTAKTSRGAHVYFRAPPDFLLFKDLHPLENGEYRGDSLHYCLLPPSTHPDGSAYEWLVPLPEGDLTLVEDLVGAGLFPGGDVTQKAQGRPRKSQVISSPVRPSDARVPLTTETIFAIEDAMRHTMPTGPGTRRKKLLELARRLRFRPEFVDVPASEIGFLRPYLQRWWKSAKPLTSGKKNFQRTWQDFVFAWEEARVPYGATLDAIYAKALATPPPERALKVYGRGSLRAILVSFCRELQTFNGGESFYLSGRAAQPYLGISDVQAWRWLKKLVEDKFIVTVKTHPKGVRLATEYRYLGD